MGRQQLESQEVSMWEARKQEVLLGDLVESRIDLFLVICVSPIFQFSLEYGLLPADVFRLFSKLSVK